MGLGWGDATWCRLFTSDLQILPGLPQLSPVEHVPCKPSLWSCLSAHCHCSFLSSLRDSLCPKAPLVWAFLSLLSPVSLLESAAASVPHMGQSLSCSGMATQRVSCSRALASPKAYPEPQMGISINLSQRPKDL